ncbi:adenylate/guanylate cyclase domain-containing protein, partial [candidate division CSSED10-310 bacterium]
AIAGRFCMFCGKELGSFCPACNKPAPLESKFCANCGTPLSKEDTAEKEKKGDTLGSGEYRFATIIFADISGFTSLSENLDPEEVTDIMNGCFDRFVKLIRFYDGTVDKFIGDCVMCLFGAPKAHENDPERAIHCACDMLTELAAYNKEIGFELGVSIGINCGKVYAGQVGGHQQHDFTVMGDTVNTAQRFESAAGRNQIYVSERFYQLTKYMTVYEKLEPVSLKGKSEPQQVYRFKELRKEQGERRDVLTGSDLPLQGRANEIEIITGCLDRLQSELGGILSIEGESGMGKTRLGREIRTLATERGMFVISSQAESFGRGWMLSLIRGVFLSDVFKTFWTNHGGDDVESRLVKIIKGKNVEMNEIDPHKSSEIKHRIIGLILRFLKQSAAEKPLVIILDDLHFVDQATITMLSDVIEASVGEGALLFCLLFRPDVEPLWLQNPLTIKVTLEGLTLNSLKNMIRDYYEIDVSPELDKFLSDRCEGNPLFLLEHLSLFQEMNVLHIDQNQLTLKQEITDAHIPDTLQGLIAASLDRLQLEARGALQTAAVIGRKFPFRLLKETITDKSNLPQNLAEILKKRLLDEVKRIPELEYIFRTAISWEVAYKAFSKKRLRQIHGLIGQAIEQIYAKQLSAHYEALAFHYSEANERPKAHYYTHQSYARSKALGDLGTAITYLEDLIALTAESKEKSQLQSELLELFILIGSFDEAGQLLTRLDEIHSSDSLSKADQARFLLSKGTLAMHEGDFKRSLAYFKEGFNIARDNNLNKLAAWILFRSAFVHFRQGNYEQAQKISQQSLKRAQINNDKGLAARCLENLANIAAEKGSYDQADQLYRKALKIAKENKEQVMTCNILLNLAGLYQDKLNYKLAEKGYRQALQKAKEIGNARVYPYAELNLGELMFLTNKKRTAEKHFKFAFHWAKKLGDTFVVEVSELYLIYYDPQRISKLSALLENPKTSSYLKALGYYLLALACGENKKIEQAQDYLIQAQNYISEGFLVWLGDKVAEEQKKYQTHK